MITLMVHILRVLPHGVCNINLYKSAPKLRLQILWLVSALSRTSSAGQQIRSSENPTIDVHGFHHYDGAVISYPNKQNPLLWVAYSNESLILSSSPSLLPLEGSLKFMVEKVDCAALGLTSRNSHPL